MAQPTLLRLLENVQKIAALSKIGRLLHHPYKYAHAIIFKEFIYPSGKKEIYKNARLFYGRTMKIALPSSTDIYLTGGKSHDSEIRLAKFIIKNLQPGDHFLDIGAHYGYFTLLAAEITGTQGKVLDFEPAAKSYALLEHNTKDLEQVTIFKEAVAAEEGTLVFFEFPNLYSEYNTTDIGQFRDEQWFSSFKPEKVEVKAGTIDLAIRNNALAPAIIKMDVEGAEYNALLGGRQLLTSQSPQLVMEYLHPDRHNTEHRKAAALLREWGYTSFLILAGGDLKTLEDIDAYLTETGMESDNIVFKKHDPLPG